MIRDYKIVQGVFMITCDYNLNRGIDDQDHASIQHHKACLQWLQAMQLTTATVDGLDLEMTWLVSLVDELQAR